MNCPSCNSSLEPNARFCGVCGYRLSPARAAAPAAPATSGSQLPGSPAPRLATPATGAPATRPASSPAAPKAQPRPKARPKLGDEIYIDQVLNNRFKVESKIGEGGFGAVYRGVQLATGRKVALKLLHPEMTKDENLVARFRREGMVLCNLRDAHTITTYDFDQTPDGTLYIAMELLEGKSLHQIFHEQAPLEWKRVFKILTEMCSSLAEAHSQGIVHRDLKPENIYLESRPGNPEFVKILDFGIAKVMRGDSIDPQSPQLTATGQTLGTLEYMSPEQLMGKPLDGRSDVYALGVVAYEMITGRLPFPDAKGPAGLITAQLKQTPPPPSAANPKTSLPSAADRVILKCLEKDKNNRFPDVSALSFALSEVVTQTSNELAALSASSSRMSGPDLTETRRGEMPNLPPPPMPSSAQSSSGMPYAGQGHGQGMQPQMHTPVPQAHPLVGNYQTPPPGVNAAMPLQMAPYPQASMAQMQQHANAPVTAPVRTSSSSRWVWWVVALLVLGAGAGAVLALVLR